MARQQSFEKKLKSFITSTLRRASLRWPARSECLRAARTSRGLYRCAMCGGDFKAREVAVDHIRPVVPHSGFDNWDGFINRLFCKPEEMQVLCHADHSSKSMLEDRVRANLNQVKKEEQKKIIKAAKKVNKDGN